ncbi:hypothetical protein C8R43DRAFT_1132336 [Mycena crocata]|nr:hypothetical protein C8R43DRAFT_1132336 [Mycena crocata]
MFRRIKRFFGFGKPTDPEVAHQYPQKHVYGPPPSVPYYSPPYGQAPWDYSGHPVSPLSGDNLGAGQAIWPSQSVHSEQLAASANGTTFNIPPSPPFTPAASSLICNAMWFISLGLALTSALVATLVEQWARDFLHRAEIRSAPVIRARVFAFLYYGIKRFKMHTVVEVIPLLLHASLVLFFGGLIAFLIPVNTMITALAAALLMIVTGVYSVLTLLPLYALDSPYKTPLSNIFWRLRNLAVMLIRRRNTESHNAKSKCPDGKDNIVDSVFRKATEASEERAARDRKALLWTLQSLTDHTELEPFVEALPDVLWSDRTRRYAYDDQILALINHPEGRLLNRLSVLYSDCFGGHLPNEISKRRIMSCYKALWAIGTLAHPAASLSTGFPDLIATMRGQMSDDVRRDSGTKHYYISCWSMEVWTKICEAQSLLKEATELLREWVSRFDVSPVPGSAVMSCLHELEQYRDYLYLEGYLPHSNDHALLPEITSFIEEIETLHHTAPLHQFYNYVGQAAWLKSPPYRFHATLQILSPARFPLSTGLLKHLQETLRDVARICLSRKAETAINDEPNWLERMIPILIEHWDPADAGIQLPATLINCMNRCDDALWCDLCKKFPITAWSSVSESIIHMADRELESMNFKPLLAVDGDTPLEGLLSFVWKLIKFSRGWTNQSTMEVLLDAVGKSEFASTTPSVIAMAKREIVESSGYWILRLSPSVLRHGVYPADSALDDPSETPEFDNYVSPTEVPVGSPPVFKDAGLPEDVAHDRVMPRSEGRQFDGVIKFSLNRRMEGLLHIHTELMEACIRTRFPSMIDSTFDSLDTLTLIVTQFEILPAQQMRFTVAIKILFDTWGQSTEEDVQKTLRRIPRLYFFARYGEFKLRRFWQSPRSSPPHLLHDPPNPIGEGTPAAWLDDAIARQLLKETFTTYCDGLSSTEYPDIVECLQKIVIKLDALHPDPNDAAPAEWV